MMVRVMCEITRRNKKTKHERSVVDIAVALMAYSSWFCFYLSLLLFFLLFLPLIFFFTIIIFYTFFFFFTIIIFFLPLLFFLCYYFFLFGDRFGEQRGALDIFPDRNGNYDLCLDGKASPVE